MSRTSATNHEEGIQSGQIVYLVGERQPDRLGRLLGTYLSQPQVERVVLVTNTPATAARVAAPYADQREEGRLATVLAHNDVAEAMSAARRGWGEPNVIVTTGGAMWSEAAAPAMHLSHYAAD